MDRSVSYAAAMEEKDQATPDPDRAENFERYAALVYRVARRLQAERAVAADNQPSSSSGEPVCK